MIRPPASNLRGHAAARRIRRRAPLVGVLGVIGALVAPALASGVASSPARSCTGTQCTVTFPAVGDYYAWQVPSDVLGPLSVDVQGAQGGSTNNGAGGNGARVTATVASAAGTTLYVYVGGQGGSGTATAPGGWNGGGAGHDPRGYYQSRGGGGASDIRTTAGDLSTRIVVAGGGGGAGTQPGPSGAAGGAGGQSGSDGADGYAPAVGARGRGASQAGGGAGGNSGPGAYHGSAGTLGVGGEGNNCPNTAGQCDPSAGYSYGGGGGGGGLYGGGGGAGASYPSGGGGGGSSGIASPATGATFFSGARSGAGQVIITFDTQVAPSFTASTAPTSATVGTPYAYDFDATGHPDATYSSTGSLPPGLVLDPATGQLAGTPTTAGTYAFAITAGNSAGSTATGQITVTVAPDPATAAAERPASPGSASTPTRAFPAELLGTPSRTTRGRITTVAGSLRITDPGSYTFIFMRPDGTRVSLSPGSLINGTRVRRTAWAPVRVTPEGATVAYSARMGSKAAEGVTLRLVRRAPGGALSAQALPQ